MKVITTTIFILLSTLTAKIIHVPQDQPSIQAGIDAALGGDTVLVDAGTYVEEVNFNGKNIVVGSLFLTTGDTSYISQTVIDGDSSNPAAYFYGGIDSSAIFTGFTINNCLMSAIYIGYSSPTLSHLKIVGNFNPYYSGGGISIYNSNPKISNVIIDGNHAEKGGGIYCNESSPTLTNVVIRGNSASTRGGGLYCTWNSNPILANVSIHYNSAQYGGGIYSIQGSYLSFDEENRCSIYLNHAAVGSDIHASPTSIAIDTFTVLIPTDYHVAQVDNFTFDILNEEIAQIEADLFVSPGGSDTNSGIDADHPLKTINRALSKIYADSLNQRTIYLSSGTYSPSINNELFPLNCVSFVSIKGEGIGNTILDAEGQSSVIYSFNNKNLVFSNMSIQNGVASSSGGGIYCRNSNPTFTNVEIRENWADSFGGGIYLYTSSPTFFDVTITGNTSNSNGGGIYCSFNSNPIFMNVLITGNTGGGIHCTHSSEPIFANVTVSNNTTQNSSGGGIFCYDDSHPVLINSTFWNNNPEEVHLYPSGFEVSQSSITVSHSNVQGSVSGINNNDGLVNWLEGNIDDDPQFIDPESGDFHLQENSPNVDAGIDLFIWNGDTLISLHDSTYQGNAPDIGAYESPYTVGINEHNFLPKKFTLHPNYPNPFNPNTIIQYELPQRSDVQVTIYDLLGRKVTTLVNQPQEAGFKSVTWNATNYHGKAVSAGVYLYQIRVYDLDGVGTGEYVQTKKMVLLR